MHARIVYSPFVVFALAAFLSTATAYAQTLTFKASLDATQEVPPNDSKSKGTADLTYDAATKNLTWTITFDGLTGPAVAAHFHGPAEPGKNAGVALPIGQNLTSPIKGSATLTEAQAADLTAGRWYVNIHTAANKGGEIRGQVTK
jgi:CHRD domain